MNLPKAKKTRTDILGLASVHSSMGLPRPLHLDSALQWAGCIGSLCSIPSTRTLHGIAA